MRAKPARVGRPRLHVASQHLDKWVLDAEGNWVQQPFIFMRGPGGLSDRPAQDDAGQTQPNLERTA